MFGFIEKVWFNICLLLTVPFEVGWLDDFVESMRTPDETNAFLSVAKRNVVVIEDKFTGDQVTFQATLGVWRFMCAYKYTPHNKAMHFTMKDVPFFYKAVLRHYAMPLIRAAEKAAENRLAA